MVKTITIMDDAYTLLKAKKGPDESFSDIIRKLCQKPAFDIRSIVGILPGGDEQSKKLQKAIKQQREQATIDYQKRQKKIQEQLKQ
ncbi:MAG: antitoxin VapB family protein [Nanoarchaeota archaeon]|nr:antitoxin VapB family protein [Nanoarchaeota archaeon]